MCGRVQRFDYEKNIRVVELGELLLLIQVFSNRRIAFIYAISEQTAKNHFTHIYEKAWVPGRKEFIELFVTEEE